MLIQCESENISNNDSVMNSVSGVHCLFCSQEGDVHQSKYDALSQSTNLTSMSSGRQKLPFYSLSIYPTDEFIDSFSTNNPRDATICALFVIALVTILFFFYDYFVQREFHERKQVLDAKRRFIRYVSHEVSLKTVYASRSPCRLIQC